MDAEHFRTLARYNGWANRRLYDAVARLPESEYFQARPSFFGSIHNTLNHIWVGDEIWLGRIEGRPPGGLKLDDRPFPDLAALRRAREAQDARIVAMAAGLDGAALAEDIVYRNSSGKEFRTRLSWVLTHLVNHQTHHRGQVHDMLSQTPVPPPELDLIYFLRQ